MNGIRGALIGASASLGITLLGAPSAIANTQDGVLDPAFGNGGIVEIAWPAGVAEANAIAVDSTGRIVVGGYATGASDDTDFVLFRLLTGGSLDTSYASDGGGFRLIDFNLAGIGGGSDDQINDIATLSDDSVVALGEAHFGWLASQFALLKTDALGAVDPAFGDGGSAHFGFDTFTNWDQGTLLRVDGFGRIVVSGTVIFNSGDTNSINYYAGVARLTPQGQLDGDFYGHGRYYAPLWGDKGTPIRAEYSLPSALLLDSADRVVISGTYFQPYPQDVALMRGPPDGGYDHTFGSADTGRVRLQLLNGYAGGVVALAGGQLMISGSFGALNSETPFLLRLNEDGSIDSSFASEGMAVAPPVDSAHYANFNFLAPTKGGCWMMAGQYGEFSSNAPVGEILVRFNASGAPDATFGDNGIVTIVPDPERHFTAHRAALQADGSLVVAGSFPASAVDNTGHFAIVRILSDCDSLFASGFEVEP